MSKKEKAVYFVEAEKRKKDHQLENPGWTNKANYVSTCRPHIFKVEVTEGEDKVTEPFFVKLFYSYQCVIALCCYGHDLKGMFDFRVKKENGKEAKSLKPPQIRLPHSGNCLWG